MTGVQKTGVKPTEQEKAEIDRLIDEALKTPVIAIGHGSSDMASQAWDRARRRCHEVALAHGLPEIDGYYGLDEDGEFVHA